MALPKKIRRSIAKQGARLLEDGQRFNRFEQIRQRHFWSSHLFKPEIQTSIISPGTFQIFSTPPGQSGQGYVTPLTELETNWKAANRVTDNQNVEITELGITLWSVPAALPDDVPSVEGVSVPISPWMLSAYDAQSFLQNTVLSITYLTNQVELGMCSDFAQAAGPQVGTYQPNSGIPIAAEPNDENNRNVTQRQQFATNGFAAPALRRKLKIPILLQHGETFSFTYTIPRPIAMLAFERNNNFAKGVVQARFIAARMDFWATESFVERS